MLDRGAHSGRRHFSCKFLYKVAVVKCCSAFRVRGLTQSVDLASGLLHFFHKFLCKVVVVKCCNAFRLRRLAQSVVLVSGLRLSPENFCIKWPL